MPGRKRAAASPTSAVRTSKRQRTKPTRTPQVIATAKLLPKQRKPAKAAKPPVPTPEEVAEKERVQLVTAITEAKAALAEQGTLREPSRRDAELYLAGSYIYRAQGEGAPVEVPDEEMIVCMVRIWSVHFEGK